jgi:hypothetical protein
VSGDYRFLPWVRRGMSAELSNADTLGALPRRADIPVRLKVNEGAARGVDVQVYGPGDVIGIDTRMIVRTEPRRYTRDYEANYFTAIEFDDPDFPWMFTPAAPGASERLRPWLVLVVVQRREGVSISTDSRRPLPMLEIEAPANASTELPDLAESWAWAHAQVITEQDTQAAVDDNLENDPLLNVSRLVCPRRLTPFTDYYACLVPAFDAGAAAGLGQPVAEGTLGPAWAAGAASVKLPVYFHWEFSTGPAGDFEALCDRLTPRPVPPGVGSQPMFIGRAGPGITELAPDAEGAIVEMEGALRAPEVGGGGSIGDVPQVIRDDLRAILDAAQEHLAAGTPDDAEPIGPPLYGRWHQKRHTVPETTPRWMRELNLDPRFRAAAGLGTEVIRKFQEEFMHLAWQQVGDVIAANRLLAWAVLSREIGRRLYARHLLPLGPESLLQLTAPLHARVLLDTKTVYAGVHRSRLPDQLVDAAFRRAASPQRPRLKRIARLDGLATDAAGGLRVEAIAMVNRGSFDIEPTNVAADGITGIDRLAELGSARGDLVDISAWGGTGTVPASMVRTARTAVEAGAAVPDRIAARSDLRSVGVITNEHFEALAAGAAGVGALAADQLEPLRATAASSPSTHGFLIAPRPGETAPSIEPLMVEGSGNVTITRPGSTPNIEVGRLARRDTNLVIRTGRLQPTRGTNRIRTRPGLADRLPGVVSDLPGVAADVPTMVVDDGTTETRAGIVVGGLIREAVFVDALAGAIADNVAVFDPGKNVIFQPPPLGVDTVRTTMLAKIDPDRVVPARVKSLIRFGAHALSELDRFGGLTLAEDLGPVMAYPSIPEPMYERLLQYDKNAFLPGIDLIPPDTITLLETNPRFIESHMVGLNVEFARELLWREYPTDRRGTYFRQFWDRLDGKLDIAELHKFNAGFSLGSNLLGAGEDHIVLLIRGQLLRRYPSTAVYAVPGTPDGKLKVDPAEVVEPMLFGRIDPDISFVGFPLTVEDLIAGDGWFFVLQEPPTEPRFGFDVPSKENPGAPTSWAEADWGDLGVEPGQHLRIAGNPLANTEFDGVRFVTNSAHLAALSLQQPVRVAMHASEALGDVDA